MSDSESHPQRKHEGFERRWIKNDHYDGPERRRGGDRRRHPPARGPETDTEQQSDADTGAADEARGADAAPTPPGRFKPFRP